MIKKPTPRAYRRLPIGDPGSVINSASISFGLTTETPPQMLGER